MNIVGIVGSPRANGNTEILISVALRAAQKIGAEIEMIKVSNLNIRPCDGCLSCFNNGNCKIQDDMTIIYNAFEKANGIILGTPSYFANVSGQAKIIIDRTIALRFSGKLRGKVGGAIVAARRVGAGQILGLLYSFFMSQGMIIAGGGIGYGKEKGEVMSGPGGSPNLTAIEEAEAVGKKIVKIIDKIQKKQ